MGIIVYLAGVITLPALYVIYAFIHWSFSKTTAKWCEVCDKNPERTIGENFNIVEVLLSWRHRIFWAQRRQHRADAQKWREKWGRA